MADTSFYGVALATLPGLVMTPRPATEQLVRTAVQLVGDSPATVADVGTGSGAIAVAFARAAPRVQVWATDNSRCAVLLARANVHRHGLGARVHVRQGDLLDPVPGPLDAILANLPYLPEADASAYPDLSPEPRQAVFGTGDGLGAYRRLLLASADRLTPDGFLAIQLHRRVLVARRPELNALLGRLARGPLAAAGSAGTPR
jgi:release factor glutamine methyltransferase